VASDNREMEAVLRFGVELPYHRQCRAYDMRGTRCPYGGAERLDGYWFCWTHASAYKNPNRREPLRLVFLPEDERGMPAEAEPPSTPEAGSAPSSRGDGESIDSPSDPSSDDA